MTPSKKLSREKYVESIYKSVESISKNLKTFPKISGFLEIP